MANTSSARKRARQIPKRTLRNKAIKSRVKTAIKNFEDSLNKGDQEHSRLMLRDAVKMIDKASAKGILHKNTAARKKSYLMRKFNYQQQEKTG